MKLVEINSNGKYRSTSRYFLVRSKGWNFSTLYLKDNQLDPELIILRNFWHNAKVDSRIRTTVWELTTEEYLLLLVRKI